MFILVVKPPPLSHSPTHNKRCIRYPIFQNHQFPFRSISALNSLTFSMSSVLRAKAKFMKKLSQVGHYFLQFIHPENLHLIFARRRQRVQRSVERRVASSGPRLPRPPSQNSTLLDSTFPSWRNFPWRTKQTQVEGRILVQLVGQVLLQLLVAQLLLLLLQHQRGRQGKGLRVGNLSWGGLRKFWITKMMTCFASKNELCHKREKLQIYSSYSC